MDLAEKKEILLHIVDEADEKLMGLLIALADEYNVNTYRFSKDDISFIKERQKAFYESGKEGSSVEEVTKRIRLKHRDVV